MKYQRQLTRLLFVVVLSLVTLISVAHLTKATGMITKADLQGNWQTTLNGVSGCGVGTTRLTFNLNTSGTASANITSHSAACGDSTTTEPFVITSLSPNGSGTANLSCGPGCGFNFDIQVSPDRSMFSLVDVTDPNNFLEGVAIHQ
jgi:hypothetical protein